MLVAGEKYWCLQKEIADHLDLHYSTVSRILKTMSGSLFANRRSRFNPSGKLNRMNKPQISVLMPVYNGEKFLREAIESILNQTYKDFEIIVLDNDSTDNKGEFLRF